MPKIAVFFTKKFFRYFPVTAARVSRVLRFVFAEEEVALPREAVKPRDSVTIAKSLVLPYPDCNTKKTTYPPQSINSLLATFEGAVVGRLEPYVFSVGYSPKHYHL